MNFNIYFDEETGSQLNRVVKQAGESRNALIVWHWENRSIASIPQWPAEVISYEGCPEMTPFELTRQAVTAPSDDPLA